MEMNLGIDSKQCFGTQVGDEPDTSPTTPLSLLFDGLGNVFLGGLTHTTNH